ncbi:MAG: L-threonine 3-dehydrogenase [Gammaproteobacteria bacterium]
MKALGKLKPEPGIWLYDAEQTPLGPNDVLIKIKKTAICGTDLHIYNWDELAQHMMPQLPMTTGHEFVGEIIEVGPLVNGFKPGMRVSGEGHITCGYCRNCRAGKRYLCRNCLGTGSSTTGCFSEYFTFPASNVFALPDDVPDSVAAILDPLGNAVHTALSFDLVGEDVLITGAGPVGLMAAAVALHVGARHVVITDVNAYRLEIANQLNVAWAVNTRETTLDDVMRELKMTEGFDVGLEMSGNATAFNDMLNHMNYGGRIAMLGFQPHDTKIDWNANVILKGLTIKGIYGREIFETWYKMVSMLQSGLDITPVITHEFAIKDFQQGFEVMQSGKSGKVILDWEQI